MIEKISNKNNNEILKYFSNKIHCLISISKEKDFLQSYKNSGIQIEEEMIILDVRDLKRAKNIRIWFEFSRNNKKTPIVLTDANFLITSRIRIIGITSTNNYIPVGIYYKNNLSEEIWSAGAIRLNKLKNDLTNLRSIFIICGIYGEGEIQVMIGPTASINKSIFESVIETVEIETMKNEIKEAKIYCCEYCETEGEIDRDMERNMKTIFYFNLF